MFDPSDLPKDLFEQAAALRSECVISATGKVRARPAGTNNPKIATGEVEVAVSALQVLNMADVLPFPVRNALESDHVASLIWVRAPAKAMGAVWLWRG